MNILVTGAAGFIGSHIADTLIAAGHHVIIVDNLHTGHRHNVPDQATFYEADIRDGAALAAIFEKEEIHAIAHEAALANVRESMTDPIRYAEVNIIGTLQLLELARKHGVKKFVFASTGGAVYGEGHRDDPAENPLPFTEKFWPRPKDNYGASKLDMEFHIDLYYQNYGMQYTILRYPNVYGPRQDSKGEAGVVAIFAGAMLAGKPTKITGDGHPEPGFLLCGGHCPGQSAGLGERQPGGGGHLQRGDGRAHGHQPGPRHAQKHHRLCPGSGLCAPAHGRGAGDLFGQQSGQGGVGLGGPGELGRGAAGRGGMGQGEINN